MKAKLLVTVPALLLLGLAGCSGNAETTADDASAMESPAATASEHGDSMEKSDDGSMEKTEDETMEKTDDGSMEKPEDESMEKSEDESMEKPEDGADDGAMKKPGAYLTWEDYDKAGMMAEGTTVLFFHADWCPACQGVDKAFQTSPELIPAGVTVVKVNYDTQTDLRQKYEVTTQTTFVQLDADGNAVKKWTAAEADQALAPIEA